MVPAQIRSGWRMLSCRTRKLPNAQMLLDKLRGEGKIAPLNNTRHRKLDGLWDRLDKKTKVYYKAVACMAPVFAIRYRGKFTLIHKADYLDDRLIVRTSERKVKVKHPKLKCIKMTP